MVFYLYSVNKSNLCLPRYFFVAFIFFGFTLLPSKLFGNVIPLLEVASILQDHCLPQTTVTELNFIQGIFSTLFNSFYQSSILSLRVSVRDILAQGSSLILLCVQVKSSTCTRSLLV